MSRRRSFWVSFLGLIAITMAISAIYLSYKFPHEKSVKMTIARLREDIIDAETVLMKAQKLKHLTGPRSVEQYRGMIAYTESIILDYNETATSLSPRLLTFLKLPSSISIDKKAMQLSFSR